MGIVAILGGPTASGKTALALRWAKAKNLEIISADSRQNYRGFCIGTGAPTEKETAHIPHHLTGFLDPQENFSPKSFRTAVVEILATHPETNFLLVGGTGLYIKELLYGGTSRGETPPEIRTQAEKEISVKGLSAVYAELLAKDPEGMDRVDARDKHRIQMRLENQILTGRPFRDFAFSKTIDARFENVPVFWLDPTRETLHANIADRIRNMAAQGWLDEVRSLLERHDPSTAPAFNALGYRELAEVARGKASLSGTWEDIAQRTRQYAKRQTTFFRHQIPGARSASPEALETALQQADWDVQRLVQKGFGEVCD